MRTALISIGNSRGVQIPKHFIKQCGLMEEVEMDVRDSSILIHSPRQPRTGWGASFAQMALRGDDKLLAPQPTPTLWASYSDGKKKRRP